MPDDIDSPVTGSTDETGGTVVSARRQRRQLPIVEGGAVALAGHPTRSVGPLTACETGASRLGPGALVRAPTDAAPRGIRLTRRGRR